jgi:hypothetical protein
LLLLLRAGADLAAAGTHFSLQIKNTKLEILT